MNRINLLIAAVLLTLAMQAQTAAAPVWQWSVPVDSVLSQETNKHPRAFLWIPENCSQVQGVVLAQHNMSEERLLEHPVFRQTMTDLGIALVWVTPPFSLTFDFQADAAEDFQFMMDQLAKTSGYEELSTTPVIPLGHSALASFPWNFAAWNPARTLAVVSLHGDAPQTNLTGSGRPNPDWEDRHIDGVPGLFIMGEFEWWEDRISPAYDYVARHPASTITLFADAGHGHFDCSDALVEYIALFIRKAAERRLPAMQPIKTQSGWLMDRWRMDRLPEATAAPFHAFTGDRRTASWVFDREMAEATEAFYATARARERQYLGFRQAGSVLIPDESHANYQLPFRPLEDGISFRLEAFFADSSRTLPVQQHAKTPVMIDPVTGPVRKLDDTTFQVDFGRLGFDNQKRSNAIWLLAHNEGDERYKSAVQQLELRFPLTNEEGQRQRIRFAPIADQREGVEALTLTAASDLALPVSYYVKEGPAFVDGNTLRFTPIPPKAKFPVKVTVVAWQYGIAGKVRSAWPVERTFFIRAAEDREILVRSLKELAHHAARDGQVIRMEPGEYHLSDYLIPDSIEQRKARRDYPFMRFSGSNNIFHLEGVSLIVDTELRTMLRPPVHTTEFLITGENNRFDGLEITYTGEGTSPGGAALETAGEGNILRHLTLRVQGSFPYGYGDLFGKGGPDVIRHQKHSGLLVTGSKTQVYACRLYMRSFGHGFFIQRRAEDVYFEDCYVEGVMRSTDDILTETSGPAFDVDFRTWTVNREGVFRVTPGYMKSLCEDGFRTYGYMPRISFVNCTAKNTRGGFELRQEAGTYLENCTTIGTERAYWVSKDAWVRNCRGDAAYGPLLFLEGSGADVDLTVMPTESDRLVHALATIQGTDNKLTLRAAGGSNRSRPIPIRISYTHPEHGEGMSPFNQAPTVGLQLINETSMPVLIGEQTRDCSIRTQGEIQDEGGENIKIEQL